MRRRSLFLSCLILTSTIVLCQSNNLLSKADYPKVIAPSPEAAALGKYGEVPVSLFSGTPQISIPVYNFGYGDISVDVSLSYNAGGIRLDEIATNVGLGWSLSAGGVITRSVLGVPDFVNDGFPDSVNNFDPGGDQFDLINFIPQSSDYFVARDVMTYNRDTERDIYYYNFLGNSGKFTFDSLGYPVLIPASPSIKILPYNGTSYLSGFIIKDDKGNKFYFTATESIASVSNPCNIGEESYREYTSNFPTAWYLTKIESSNNRVVTYEYQAYTYTVKRSYNEVKYIRDVLISGCYDQSNNDRKCTRVETINGLRIKKIVLADMGADIVFGYSSGNRLDLAYNGQDAGHSLDSIYILRNGVKENPWYLSYGYFGTGSSRRLKLQSVTQGTNSPHQFTYNETYPLPERLSFSQDHWGFYNGKSANTGLIPVIPERGYASGANREPDFAYMQSASLTRIKYPTGGYTDFVYEPHKDRVTEDSNYYVGELSSLSILSNSGTSYTDQNFTLPSGATEIYISWELTPGDPQDLMYGYITDPNNTSIIYKTVDIGSGSELLLNLTPGETYKLRVFRANTADDALLTVSWQKLVTTSVTHQKIIYGGLRIKSTRNYGSDDLLINKKMYFYNDLSDTTKSTAIIPGYNVFKYWDDYNIANENAANNPFVGSCPYYVLYSATRPEIGAGLDGSIGYKQVVETDTSSGINGRTIYRYSSKEDFLTGGVTFQIEGANHEWTRGMLLEKKVQKYDNASSTYKDVTKTRNYYKTVSSEQCRVSGDSCKSNQKVIHNFKINYLRKESPAPNNYTWAAVFSVEKYFIISNWVFLDSTVDVQFNQASSDSVVMKTKHYYAVPSHGFPTSTETSDSKNLVIKTENKYPSDFSGITVYDTMVVRNKISPVIEQKSYRNNTLLSTKKINYALWQSNQIVAEDYVQVAKLSNPLTTELDFSEYDNYGNPLQFIYKDGVIKSYIWDYQKLYPVAEIANAQSSQIAHSSFESDGKGGWTFSGSVSVHPTAVTGSKGYSLAGGNITKSGLTSGTSYVITYWKKDSSSTVTVNSASGTDVITINGWKLIRHEITGTTSMTISGTAYIDELRLYPKGAQMTTYTYTPLIGVSSQCDANNRIIYYEYDSFNRLKAVRDQDRKILKRNDYQYQTTTSQQ